MKRRIMKDIRIASELPVIDGKDEENKESEENKVNTHDFDSISNEISLVHDFLRPNDFQDMSLVTASPQNMPLGDSRQKKHQKNYNRFQRHSPRVGMVLKVPLAASMFNNFRRIQNRFYELTERVHDELGLVDKYHLDWAYKPVAKLDSNVYREFSSSKTKKREQMVTLNSGRSRFPWLHSHSFGYITNSFEHGRLYECVGNAFAGGSHGEVWRARRRCDILPSGRIISSRSSHDNDCDSDRELVMKRLNVFDSVSLFEAGLREVYFGEFLSNNNDLGFTKYIDHFYRNETSLELWIVFENAGPSLRSIIYTAIASDGFVMFQQSSFWRRLRLGVYNQRSSSTRRSTSAAALITHDWNLQSERSSRKTRRTDPEGRALMREVLFQLLNATAFLHERGIVHRDIKPSNVLCKLQTSDGSDYRIDDSDVNIKSIRCVLGDFSSAWDEFSVQALYVGGLTSGEITEEYAPPEVLFGDEWIPFDHRRPESYDLWSIGVLALELLLGSPNVFSVDQRTTSVLTNRLKKEGANEESIRRALFLAALSQFCIHIPSDAKEGLFSLGGTPIVKNSCTIEDFHTALRARDPLGIGFDSSTEPLLRLIWSLLVWDPLGRISASDALEHEYFLRNANEDKQPQQGTIIDGALVPQMIDPRMTTEANSVHAFKCPKCGKTFTDWNSCHRHATSRKHAQFCDYERGILPSCLSSHTMLPAHPTSGYCDIQGRRPTIEDFHTVVLQLSHQFYGVFDGHNGNLASKYAASDLYTKLTSRFVKFNEPIREIGNWKVKLETEVIDAFNELHTDFLRVAARTPGGVMGKSGTTVTVLYVTKEFVLIANVGDSRAILSKGASYDPEATSATAIPLTVDHTPADNFERERVEKAGGFIKSEGGTSRVGGLLAITRSIGDAHIAEFLVRTPHVTVFTRQELRNQCKPEGRIVGDDSADDIPCFVVLASDGLWDVVSNEDAVNLVVHVLRQHDSENGISWEKGGAFQEAAQRLTHEAYIRGSTDNIGVCVVAIP